MWERPNRRGNRVSTISLLGCSTSVALATGPTDEEEESKDQNQCSSPSIADEGLLSSNCTLQSWFLA